MRTADDMMGTADDMRTAVVNRSAVMLLEKSGTSLPLSSVAMMRTAVMRTADDLMGTEGCIRTEVCIRTAVVNRSAVGNRSAVMLLEKSGTSLPLSSVAMMRTAVMRTADDVMGTEVCIRTAVLNRSAVVNRSAVMLL